MRVIATGAPVDVSAVLLTRHGKLRSDRDLVFYNHPSHDGVRTGSDTVTAELPEIPDDVHTVAVIASIGLEALPTAVFDQYSTWRAEITQLSGDRLSFEPDPFASGETVTIAVEIYRHGSGWKVARCRPELRRRAGGPGCGLQHQRQSLTAMSVPVAKVGSVISTQESRIHHTARRLGGRQPSRPLPPARGAQPWPRARCLSGIAGTAGTTEPSFTPYLPVACHWGREVAHGKRRDGACHVDRESR
ncbi:TerD family protein [Streptomyces sp. NPDC056653]|uniref:TerD family protein n=1 Tax=Streptomyces sp. NPDC056653 TaxID=3345894 RepID=UPI0036A7CD48